MRARVSAKELAGGSLVNAAVYLLVISKYEEKPGTKDPSSTTAHITMNVVCDSQGSQEFKDARVMIFPNEKSLGIPPNPSFLLALGAEVTEDGIDAKLSNDIVGRHVEAYVERGKDNNGKEQNQPKEFTPPGRLIPESVLSQYGVAPLVTA